MKYSRKHILNKRLKPVRTPDGISLYPVYIQVIYQRKNYSFKSIIQTYYAILDDIRNEDQMTMRSELEFLDAVLKFEFEKKSEKLEIVGFADRFNHYRLSAIQQIELVLIDKLKVFLGREYKEYFKIIDFEFLPGKLKLLLNAVKLLYPKIDEDYTYSRFRDAQQFLEVYKKTFPENRVGEFIRPSVFDWISGDHLSVIKNVMKYNQGGNSNIDFEYLEEFDSLMKQVTIYR